MLVNSTVARSQGKLGRSSADWLLNQALVYIGQEGLGIRCFESV
jgi:hypothetical protein